MCDCLSSLEGRSPIIVLNKIDLARPGEVNGISGEVGAGFPALTGEGVGGAARRGLLERGAGFCELMQRAAC